MSSPIRSRVVALLSIIMVSMLIFITTFSSIVASQTDIQQTIMLEKTRPAVVLVVTIPHGYVVWDEYASLFEEVGLGSAVYVETGMFGSGFFVSPDGYIITNGHVVNEFESDLQEKLPLLQSLVNTYAEAYAQRYGGYPDNSYLSQMFYAAVNAYVSNKLKIQDYSVDVYVCMGKTLTGYGNIKKCLPARIFEATPFEKEDLALLKVEVSHAPSLIVSSRDTVNIGETAWVLGYPGAVTFHELLSTSTQMIPTITKGMVSGYREKTTGITVLQSDVNVNHGNSGGPMIDSSGQVVAVTSFGSADPTGSGREVPGFNFFIPSKYVRELLSRNNVDNKQDPIMSLYEQGLELYYNKHYSAAIEKFQLVKNLNPGFPYVDEYITNAQAAVLRGEDVPLEESKGFDPLLLVAIVGVVAAGAGFTAFMWFKRKKASAQPQAVPQYPQYIVQQQPTVTTQSATAPPTAPAPQEYKFCWNCGRRIPADAKICPYCGASQEE